MTQSADLLILIGLWLLIGFVACLSGHPPDWGIGIAIQPVTLLGGVAFVFAEPSFRLLVTSAGRNRMGLSRERIIGWQVDCFLPRRHGRGAGDLGDGG